MIAAYTEERQDWDKNSLNGFPPAGVIWVFMRKGGFYGCTFICPCGCDECVGFIPLQDYKQRETRWNYSLGPNGPTISPSIKFGSGCKGHFNITDGKAIVHADSGK